jgi:multidrug efflux system outer membrane protein
LKIVTSSPAPLFRTLLACTILATAALPGCSWPGDPVGVEEQSTNLKGDIMTLYGAQEPINAPLTMYDAMARGVKYNIGHRTALMEEVVANGSVDVEVLGMLPGLDLEAGYIGRSRPEAIRARSSTSGTETLPSSIFQDEHRRVANLDLSWNVLDAGLSYVHSRQASDKARASLERRRKVVQNITHDVRYAYWRAASAQILSQHIEGLMTRADDILRQLEEAENSKSNEDVSALLNLQKRLYDTMKDLMAERDSLATAKAELAALIGVPPATDFTLANSESDMMSAQSLPKLSTSRQDLEVLALLIRPEMREHTLLKRVAARGSTISVMETFPGIGGIVGYNYDSNSFLDDENWASFSFGLTQNLMNLFTLPIRLEQDENREKLADMQRMAMVATVLTQLSIADTRYDIATDNYGLLKRMMGVNTRLIEYTKSRPEKTILGDGLLLAAEMDQIVTRVRLHSAYAEGQNAFGRIVSTLGLDPLPPGLEEKNIPELSNIIEARFDALDGEVISTLLSKIRERTNLLAPEGGITPVLRPQSVLMMPASIEAVPPAAAQIEEQL